MKLLHYFLIGSVPLSDLSTWQCGPENPETTKQEDVISQDYIYPKGVLNEELTEQTIDWYDQSFA